MPRKTTPAPGAPPPSVTLESLEQKVAELSRFRDELSFRVKVGLGTVLAIVVALGVDVFVMRVLKGAAQQYLEVPTRAELSQLIWTEMSDQVATSYSTAFDLGTLEQAQGATTRKYATLPFFAPSDLAGVTACYSVNHTGSREPTGIEVRVDESAKVVVIPPPPEDESGRRHQHGCLDDLPRLAGTGAGVGSLEHVLSFALADKSAVGDRKDVTVLVNVVGRLQARKEGKP